MRRQRDIGLEPDVGLDVDIGLEEGWRGSMARAFAGVDAIRRSGTLAERPRIATVLGSQRPLAVASHLGLGSQTLLNRHPTHGDAYRGICPP
jgi:hypothetical protein